MNSFDECRLSPISGRWPNQKVALVKGNNRPKAVVVVRKQISLPLPDVPEELVKTILAARDKKA